MMLPDNLTHGRLLVPSIDRRTIHGGVSAIPFDAAGRAAGSNPRLHGLVVSGPTGAIERTLAKTVTGLHPKPEATR